MSNTSNETMMEELKRLREENEKLKSRTGKGATLQLAVSEKGAVSIYGIRRMPISLYPDEFAAIAAKVDAIKAFIESHKEELQRRGEATRASANAGNGVTERKVVPKTLV